ncbi:hypothetical protein T484DRAFT_3285621 [Baffinella frigidus]|nr:hypothetical protein T484DRAFT_3285621 [Cryptophyta sp. CCMP2293]
MATRCGAEVAVDVLQAAWIGQQLWEFLQPQYKRHYDITGHLGQGKFAVVKKARHKETGELFAIKIIEKNSFMQALNPTHETQNTKHEARNTKPETRNPKP